MEHPPKGPAPAADDAAPAPAVPPLARAEPLASDQLFQGRRMVEIAHNGEVYRLQATRLGKLILTK